jgi:hypothetical protein
MFSKSRLINVILKDHKSYHRGTPGYVAPEDPTKPRAEWEIPLLLNGYAAAAFGDEEFVFVPSVSDRNDRLHVSYRVLIGSKQPWDELTENHTPLENIHEVTGFVKGLAKNSAIIIPIRDYERRNGELFYREHLF